MTRTRENPRFCREYPRLAGTHVLLAMQKVEGSNPFSHFGKGVLKRARYSGSSLIRSGQLAASPATVSGTPSNSPTAVSWPSSATVQPNSF
jgi:hypothetical protein